MSVVKKWSTGPLGNNYPDHSERGNPNTRGLSDEGIPGVEGYIEEDQVIANSDNRPLENLAQNDAIIENNIIDVAANVDYGVIKDRYEEFDIEVLDKDNYQNPESDDPNDIIEITPIRIKSGSAFVNGQVTRIGNQKIIYFLKDDDSFIFPDYVAGQGRSVIEIYDNDYFGSYRPVYDTLATDLPTNFTDFEIKIINLDSTGQREQRNSYFNTYRNWEDIIPYQPESEQGQEILSFQYDTNYGQDSEGVWLNPENDYINVKVSDVEVKKDIEVLDKYLDPSQFKLNPDTGRYEYIIETDGIFFDNIRWSASDDSADILDVFVEDNDDIYFIYDPYSIKNTNVESYLLYILNTASGQVDNIEITRDTSFQKPQKLVNIEDFVFVLGEGSLIKFLKLSDDEPVLYEFINSIVPTDDETFRTVELWDGNIWIATDKVLYYTDYELFKSDPINATFSSLDFDSEIRSIRESSQSNIDHIQGLYNIKGNYVIDSSLQSSIENLLENPSFEDGGIGNKPNYWNVSSSSGSTTLKIAADDASFGHMKAVMSPAFNDNENSVYQDVLGKFSVEENYTFSIYTKSTNDVEFSLYVYELDSDNNVLSSSFDTFTSPQNNTWNRYSVSHEIENQDTVKIRSELKKSNTEKIQIDGAQLEIGSMPSQFVYGFDYFLVTFKKENDNSNPPYAIIDKRKKYEINYVVNQHGHIKSINDVLNLGNNQIHFIDNKSIYTMHFMNDIHSYDRISISNMSESIFDEDFAFRIDKLNSLEILDNRIYFSGSIRNKALSIILNDGDQHDVKLIPPDEIPDGSGLGFLNFLEIIGDYKFIQANNTVPASIEFYETNPLEETTKTVPVVGKYSPDQIYAFGIVVDGQSILMKIDSSPERFSSPWHISDIYNKLDNFTFVNKNSNESNPYNIIDWHFENSTVLVDGLYSLGKTKVTRYIRGNVNKIFKQKSAEDRPREERSIYVARENTILKSKYDPNIKKIGAEYPSKPSVMGYVDSMDDLPDSARNGEVYHVDGWGYYKWSENNNEWQDTNYFYRWNFSDDESRYSLREFDTQANIPITFNDTTANRVFKEIPSTQGFKILPGTLRVKINDETEFGFVEGRDYFVNYEDHTIIRNNGYNLLKDSEMNFVDDSSSSWNLWSPMGDPVLETSSNEFENYAQLYIIQQTTDYAIVYQNFKPKTISPGETYTFSIFVKCDAEMENSDIRLSETISTGSNKNDTTFGTFDYENNSEISSVVLTEDNDNLSKWVRFEVSKTIQNPDTDSLRVEFRTDINYQVLLKDAQLEENPFATPFISESGFSRIDPQSTIYCDFVEYRELEAGVDYEFGGNDTRRVCLYYQPSPSAQLFFDYMYERVFNPYRFGSSIPLFDVKYDNRDDFFLYENSGRIWAINQILSLLSLDEESPINVSYNYHYPRVDKIKVRNKPDQYGNFVYIVKGRVDVEVPYAPGEFGDERDTHVDGVYGVSIDDVNNDDNEMLYEINVLDLDFEKNDIYDRRIFVEGMSSDFYNISLSNETLAYFPFVRDFVSTNGIHPINELEKSRIVSIIKNYSITQNEEVGAWSGSYQLALRFKGGYPEKVGTSLSTFVDSEKGRDDDPNFTGDSQLLAFKTVGRALRAVEEDGANPNIVISSDTIINENIEINSNFDILITAKTHTTWRGAIQNRTNVTFQGIRFENTGFYVINEISFYHCDFINSTINNYYPVTMNLYNCIIEDIKNPFLRISSQLFPTPFAHPYMRNVSRDDTIPGSPESVATSDNESIHPGDTSFNFNLFGDPVGNYTFHRCLINGATDDVVNYDLSDDQSWSSEFNFERCTIVNNKLLFNTKKIGQTIFYNECIIWNNGETRLNEKKYFDSRSNIELLNSFIDFSTDPDVVPAQDLNFNPLGDIYGRETCGFSGPGVSPGFVDTDPESEDYHLRSIAKGFLTDSVCLNKTANGRDIGAYDEIRERVDQDVPKKFKSNFAYIAEGIQYPIVLNSEKVTFTVEFKPTQSYNKSGVFFDTRSQSDDDDYITVVYNNNSGESITDIEQDPSANPSNPYSFKIIVANRNKRYAVISPMEFLSDENFQDWHKISFTINYERTFNSKASFDEKDKYQNIITFYHNEQLAVEAFIKNDLNRDEKGDLIQRRVANIENANESFIEEESTNNWNFNNISHFITIGGSFDNAYSIEGYYSELRIDNKFIDRKELEIWNAKTLPFNDPTTYVDESTFVKTFDSSILNEFWSLKDSYGVGAKGNEFGNKTKKRIAYESGEQVWSLNQPTTNYIKNSDFSKLEFASITTDVAPILNGNLNKRMFISTTGSRVAMDNSPNDLNPDSYGISIRFYTNEEEMIMGKDFVSASELVDHINKEIFRVDESGNPVNGNTYIRVRLLDDNKIQFYTRDYSADGIRLQFENQGDATEMGFKNTTLSDWNYQVSITPEINVYFVDRWRTDSYTPDGSPAYPFRTYEDAEDILTPGFILKIVDNETTTSSTYEDFGVDTSNQIVTFQGKQISSSVGDRISIEGITTEKLGSYEVWPEFGKAYTRFGNSSLGFTRKRTLTAENNIKVYFNNITKSDGSGINLIPNTRYTFSMYIYSEDDISNREIRLLTLEDGVEHEHIIDSFERVSGRWRKVVNTFVFNEDDLQPNIGFIIRGNVNFYVDAVQLEEANFSSPFIKDKDDNQGVIEIDKSLIREEKGIIFFRFKPVVNFETEDELTLMEIVKYSTDETGDLIYPDPEDPNATNIYQPIVDWDAGFRITYHYEPSIDRGFITFKANSLNRADSATYRFRVIRSMWNQWHSVGLYYDYPTDRFIYYYDHYKVNTEAGAVVRPFASNLYIGRDVPKVYTTTGEFEWTNGVGNDSNLNSKSADILIKDIVITNYPVSDREVSTWKNVNEFYKENSFIQLLNIYQEDISNRINNLESVSQGTIEIVNKIDNFESNIDLFEQTIENTINNQIPEIKSNVATNTNNIRSNQDKIVEHEARIDFMYDEQNNQGLRISTNEDDIVNNNNLITDEVQARVNSIEKLKDKISVHPTNYDSDGAAFIGLIDSNNRYSAVNVENALAEIAGDGRDSDHTVKGNWDLVQTNISDISNLRDDFDHAVDGDTDTWTQAKAKNNRWNIADIRTDVNSNDSDIATLQTNLSQEISDREQADTNIVDDLASIQTNKGASLVGVEDSEERYDATDVESALAEIAGDGRTNQTVKSNYDAIISNDSDISDIQDDISDINTNLLEIGKVKDGENGDEWDSTMNLKSHNDRLDTAEFNISNNLSAIQSNDIDISKNRNDISSLEDDLADEVSNRTQGDTNILNNLSSTASGKGASLIGINDSKGSFDATTVEAALSEIVDKIQTLENNLNWKSAVSSHNDLPDENNDIGDARTVLDDGDGFASQYVWNGNSWVKIADINWGEASDISFNNTDTKIESTSVQSAIEEVYRRSADPTKSEDSVESNNYSSSGDNFFYDIQHDLEAYDVSIVPTSKTDGRVVGVESIEMLDENTTRIWVSDDSEGLDFTVFGIKHNYSKTVGSWTSSNGSYFHTLDHKLNSKKMMTSVFDINTGHLINLDEIIYDDDNTTTLWTTDNSIEINVYLLKRTSETKIKDIDNWKPVNGMFEAKIKMPEDFDAVYQFLDPSSGTIVGVEGVWFTNGFLNIRSSDDNRLRLLILK